MMQWILPTFCVVGIVLKTTTGVPLFENVFGRSSLDCQSATQLRELVGDCVPGSPNEFVEVLQDSIITGSELFDVMSTVCGRIPQVLQCTQDAVNVCPELESFLLDPLYEGRERNCNGSVPAGWLQNAYQNYVFDLGCLKKKEVKVLRKQCFMTEMPKTLDTPGLSFDEKAAIMQPYIDNIFFCMGALIPTLFEAPDPCGDAKLYIIFAYTIFSETETPGEWVSPSDKAFKYIQDMAGSD
ncbi:hypothetical protein ACF0H5_012095 [Mactra antiquata]